MTASSSFSYFRLRICELNSTSLHNSFMIALLRAINYTYATTVWTTAFQTHMLSWLSSPE